MIEVYLPSNIECENFFLAICFDEDHYLKVKETFNQINPDIFFDDNNKQLFEIIYYLYNEQKDVNYITVYEEIKKKNNNELFDQFNQVIHTKKYSFSSINSYLSILYEKLILRKLVLLSKNLYEDTNKKDVFAIIEELNDNLEKIEDTLNFLYTRNNFKDTVDEVLLELDNSTKKSMDYFSTSNKIFDNCIQFGSPGEILLVGGKSGSYKTRFVTYLMKNLLKNNKDKVAILWYNMEDSYLKIIRLFISYDLRINETDMQNKKKQLNSETIHNIQKNLQKIKEEYDIEFVDEPTSIKDINKNFSIFCHNRKDKFCILIIDNLMLLTENDFIREQTKADDIISREIKKITVKTNRNGMKSMTILLHHFTDEQLSKANIKDAYRPREVNLKGSTRYRDISTQIVLINQFNSYLDLLAEYYLYKKILENLFITEIVKNRNIGQLNTIRWWALPEYAYFEEINIKKEKLEETKQKKLEL